MADVCRFVVFVSRSSNAGTGKLCCFCTRFSTWEQQKTLV